MSPRIPLDPNYFHKRDQRPATACAPCSAQNAAMAAGAPAPGGAGDCAQLGASADVGGAAIDRDTESGKPTSREPAAARPSI